MATQGDSCDFLTPTNGLGLEEACARSSSLSLNDPVDEEDFYSVASQGEGQDPESENSAKSLLATNPLSPTPSSKQLHYEHTALQSAAF